jgi:hypothetical protein
MLGVVVHYLAKDPTARFLLIGLRELIGAYSGENIAVCVLQVIKEMLFADNDSPNDTGVADPARRRLRCLGHIRNLSAKDLLFGKVEGSFDFEVSEMAKLKMEVRQALSNSRVWGGARSVSTGQVAQSRSLDPEGAPTYSEIQGSHY